jgi:hypothetical protein
VPKLSFCYISGLDLRRVDAATTPFLYDACNRYARAAFVNLPSNELFPTLVTGVDPTVHGVWGVKVDPLSDGGLREGALRRIPDALTTSVQGILHLVGKTFDLAAIPPGRRRRFRITRTKYKRRTKSPEALYRIGGVPTLFDVVGRDRSRYFFDAGYHPDRTLLAELCGEAFALEFVELYSIDRHQQWNLDRPDAVRAFYTRVDDFLRRLHEKCDRNGWSLLVVSDHGREPIRGSYDVGALLRGVPIPPPSYSFFVEVSSARFWFHSDAARSTILPLLREIPNASVIRFDEMGRYGIPLADPGYGEFFVFLDPGHIFFPHDFHHPLANLWLGLTDRMQRARLRDPRHRGNHGHLPHFEAERAFALLLEPGYRARQGAATILDVAPTALSVLGLDSPPSMAGRSLFEREPA